MCRFMVEVNRMFVFPIAAEGGGWMSGFYYFLNIILRMLNLIKIEDLRICLIEKKLSDYVQLVFQLCNHENNVHSRLSQLMHFGT